MNFATQLKVAANTGFRDNPSLQGQAALLDGYLRPIRGAEQAAVDWKDLPPDLVLRTVQDVARTFVSTPENPRIGSFRYFDSAVRKAHKGSQPDTSDQRMAEVIAQMQQDYEKGVL